MKKSYSPLYFIGQAFQGLWRNGVMTFASVAVLMSCLVVLGGFTLLVFTLDINLNNLGNLNQIVAYTEPTATEDEILSVESSIKSLDNIDTIKRITKAEALEELKNEAPDNADLYSDINETNNPLSDSFIITYKDNSKVSDLDYKLNQIEGIRKVNNRIALANTLESFKNGVMIVFVWFLVILLVVSMFIIVNTVKLSVFSRRDEVTVMRYVGATGSFIATPFIAEGVIIGTVAAFIAFFIEWFAYHYVEAMVATKLQMISVYQFSDVNIKILIGFIGIGIVTGIIGSLISLRKYLSV